VTFLYYSDYLNFRHTSAHACPRKSCSFCGCYLTHRVADLFAATAGYPWKYEAYTVPPEMFCDA